MVANRRWSLTGSLTNSNLTDGGTNQDFGQVVAPGGSTVKVIPYD